MAGEPTPEFNGVSVGRLGYQGEPDARRTKPRSMTGVGVEAFKRRFPDLARKYEAATGQLPGTKSGHSARDSWIDPVWNLLYLSGTTSKSVHLIMDDLGKEKREFAGVILRAYELRLLCQSRGRKATRFAAEFRTGGRPVRKDQFFRSKRPPAAVMEIVRKFEPVLPQLVADDRKSVVTALAYYVNNAWKTEFFLIFRDPSAPEDAVRYLKFLEALGFTKDRVRFIFFDLSERSSARRKWKIALGLTWRHRNLMEFRKPPFKTSVASKQWLAIEPNFESDKPRSQRAFRFLMLMAAITFGYEPELVK